MSTIEKVRGIIAGHLKRPKTEVGDHSHLNNDLGADSLHMIEIAVAVEDEFEIEVSDAEAEAACTAAQIATLVDSKLRGSILG